MTDNGARLLLGLDRAKAATTIAENHYTRSMPSGKNHVVGFGDAIVVWSIPANKNIAAFILPAGGTVWELARLYAPDGHAPNLLTQAISRAVKLIRQIENPDALVSYADPAAGHHGGIYRAASWIPHGTSEESRSYARGTETLPRRAFHSGSRSLTKAEIEQIGWTEITTPGKIRFVLPLSRAAKKQVPRG